MAYTCDSTTNEKGEPVVVYMNHQQGATFFEEAVLSKAESHDTAYITTECNRIMEAGPSDQRRSGFTMDNTNTNKAAWKELEKMHRDKFFHGCVCHGFHLAVGDIISRVAGMKEAIDLVKDIIFFVFRHHKILCDLRSLTKNDAFLKKPSATRWGSIKASIESLLDNEKHLLTVFNQPTFVTGARSLDERRRRTEYRAKLSDPMFIGKLKQYVIILSPWCNNIVRFENDAIELSEVYNSFEMLKEEIENMRGVSSEDKAILEEVRQNRYYYCHTSL